MGYLHTARVIIKPLQLTSIIQDIQKIICEGPQISKQYDLYYIILHIGTLDWLNSVISKTHYN